MRESTTEGNNYANNIKINAHIKQLIIVKFYS